MADEVHVLLTGPIAGKVRLDDGTEIDVTPPQIVLSSLEEVAEVCEQIGLHYEQNGHPDDVELDESGARVQRDFVYDDTNDQALLAAAQEG